MHNTSLADASSLSVAANFLVCSLRVAGMIYQFLSYSFARDNVSGVLPYLWVLSVRLSVDGLVTAQQKTTHVAEGRFAKNDVNIN